MRIKKLTVGLGLALTVSCLSAEQNHELSAWAKDLITKADFSFIKTVVIPPDNDFDYFHEPKGKKIPVPEKVLKAMVEYLKGDFKNLVESKVSLDGEDVLKYLPSLKEIYSSVCLIKGPTGLQVYVVHVSGGPRIHDYYLFFLFDPKSGLFGPEPLEMDSRWIGIGDDPKGYFWVKKPFLSFENIADDGNPGIVVEERLHNGTSNAVLYHYYSIGPGLEWNELLVLGSRFLVYERPGQKDYEWYSTKIVGHKNGKLEVQMVLEGKKLKPIPAGRMFLTRNEVGSGYKVTDDRPLPGMMDPAVMVGLNLDNL